MLLEEPRSVTPAELPVRRPALFLVAARTPTLDHAQRFTQPGQLTAVPAPVPMDTTGMARAAVGKVGDEVYSA